MKTLPNHFFFEITEQILQEGKEVKIRLVGNSMYPFLYGERDILTLSPISDHMIKPGEIVLFKYHQVYLLHRIIRRQQNEVMLCGDRNSHLYEVVNLEQIIGILTRVKHPDGKVIDCSSISWRFKGKLWIQLLPIRKFLIYFLLLIIKKPAILQE